MLNESQLKRLMDDDEYERFIQELNPKDLQVKETLREAVRDMGGKMTEGKHPLGGEEAGEASEGKEKEGSHSQSRAKEDSSKRTD